MHDERDRVRLHRRTPAKDPSCPLSPQATAPRSSTRTGVGQPIVFSHGWPLSADDWDNQMLFFLARLPRHRPRPPRTRPVDADRRRSRHGPLRRRSGRADRAPRPARRHPRRALHRWRRGRALPRPARRESGRQGRNHQRGAAADGARPTPTRRPAQGACSTICRRSWPPTARSSTAPCRGPVLRLQPPGVEPSEAIIENWWRQGMMGGAKAALRRHRRLLADRLHRGPEEDHRPGAGDAQRRRPDRPVRGSGPKSAELLPNGTLKTYQDFPHGMPTTHADTINADLLEFLRS